MAERCAWVMNGSYGAGVYYDYRRLSKRSNRVAYLAIMVAALDLNCPNAFARQAFNELSQDCQNQITALIKAEIEKDDEERESN